MMVMAEDSRISFVFGLKESPKIPIVFPSKRSHLLLDLIHHPQFLFLVHFNHGIEDLKRIPLLLSQS